MRFDQINLQESKKQPEDIFDFLESVFGHEIFFVEDLLRLNGEHRRLFRNFLHLTEAENPDKHKLSLRLGHLIKLRPDRIEKYPLGININGKVSFGITAFRISDSSLTSAPPLNRMDAVAIFKQRFASLIASLPDKQKKPEKIPSEEIDYYKRLKKMARAIIAHQSYFEIDNCPSSSKRNEFIRSLLKRGLILYKTGGPTTMLENCTFALPEDHE